MTSLNRTIPETSRVEAVKAGEHTTPPEESLHLHTLILPPRSGFRLNWSELWAYRELLYFFVWRDLKVRYKQTAIGVGWAIIQPLFTMAIFAVVFGHLAKMPSEGLPHPVFYYTALLPWTYFAGALTYATNSVVEHQSMITKVYFPRVLLPLSAVLSGLADFVLAFGVLVGLVLFYGIVPTPAVLLWPLFLLLAVATALAVSLWLSALNALYRDVRYAVPFLVQLWLFASPVAYPAGLVPPNWRWLYGLNPMAGVIEGFRWSLTGQGQPPGLLVLASTIAVICLLVGGLMYFQRVEGTMADTV
jgi:lipopolysaccharide transport system permease protein